MRVHPLPNRKINLSLTPTMAVQLSASMRKPVTSVYNATKFAGYGAAPAVLSIVFGAFHLTGIRYSCMAAVVVSSLLVIKGITDAKKVKIRAQRTRL
jgi:hypothetical protein